MSKNKVGRNDPCPCGSGKKYKQCCQKLPGGRKLTAKVIKSGSSPKKEDGFVGTDLIKRAFGQAYSEPPAEIGVNTEKEEGGE